MAERPTMGHGISVSREDELVNDDGNETTTENNEQL